MRAFDLLGKLGGNTMTDTKTSQKPAPVTAPAPPMRARYETPEPHEAVERQQGDREKEPGVKEKQQS